MKEPIGFGVFLDTVSNRAVILVFCLSDADSLECEKGFYEVKMLFTSLLYNHYLTFFCNVNFCHLHRIREGHQLSSRNKWKKWKSGGMEVICTLLTSLILLIVVF